MLKAINISILLSLFLLTLVCCSKQVDIKKDREDLVRLLAQERKAHFDKDIDLFISSFADTVVSVYGGEVDLNTPEDNKARFGPYFKSVEFIKWDDIEAPRIDISEDGSMAYAAIKKQIVLTYPDTLGNPLIDSAQYAWVSIYRKIDGTWKVVCNASTSKL